MEYEAALATADEIPALGELHRHLMRRPPGFNERYLTWKYFENPALPDPLVAVARVGGDVVAMRGAYGSVWHDGVTQTLTLPHADDLVVRPDHRGRGLFTVLNRVLADAARDRGYSAIISLSGGATTQALATATRWVTARDLERRYLLREGPTGGGERWPLGSKIRRVARRYFVDRGAVFKRPPTSRVVDAAASTITPAVAEVSVDGWLDFESASHLVSSVGAHTASRSADHIAWRLANPDRVYRFVTWSDPVLRGYMILAWTTQNAGRVFIADYAASDGDVFHDMASSAASIAASVEMLDVGLPAPHRAILERLGFVTDPDGSLGPKRAFMAYPLSRPLDKETLGFEPDHWRVDYLDTMHA